MTDLCTISDFKAWLGLGLTNSWVKNTAYALNEQIVPVVANGYYYKATTAGQSGATTEPTWPKTIGTTVTDNAVTWTCAGVTDDLVIARLITAESHVIYKFLDRHDLLSDTYDEIRSGNGYGHMQLFMRHWPITAVSAVTINGLTIPAKSVTANFFSSGFKFDDKSIVLMGYAFEKGIDNVEVEYTAGYDSIPADITQACIELTALRYRERTRIGENSKSLAGEVVSFNTKAMTDSILESLNRYRRVIPV
jgi:hypothetical protein